MKLTAGRILQEFRIRQGYTLREFCMGRNLDAVRYSLIERNELVPNLEELQQYLDLWEEQPKKPKPKPLGAVITKDVDGFGIRMFVRDMIFPELVAMLEDQTHSFRVELQEALGIK